MSTLDLTPQRENRITTFIKAASQGDRGLWNVSLTFLALTVVSIGLQFVDAREINGANVWMKPAKFFFSLAVHFITISWAISFLTKPSSITRWSTFFMVGAGIAEMIYIVVRAFRGEGSHFNTATPIDAALYSLMGIGALTLTITSFVIGVQLWRQRGNSLMTEAASLGLTSGAVLGTIAGAYLSSQTGHWVGGEMSDANGTGIFGWSTTGGDLRIAHFIGLHATQIVPLVAVLGKRPLVYGAVLVCAITTLAAFLQASAGVPLFRM